MLVYVGLCWFLLIQCLKNRKVNIKLDMIHILLSFYINIFLFVFNFIKLMSFKLPRRNSSKVILIAYLIFMPLVLYLIRINIPYIHIPVIIITLYIVLKHIYKNNFLLTTNAILFAIGITYAFGLIGITITMCTIFPIFINILDNIVVLEIISSAIQLIANILLFRFKRFKNGLTFLKSEKNASLGTLISIVIIILVMLISNNNSNPIYVVPVVSIFCLISLLYLWNKSKLEQSYLSMSNHRQYVFLQQELSALNAEHERLSKLIHKDSKAIPILELAVRNVIENSTDKDNAKKILSQLKTLAEERKEILYKSSSTVLYQTGIVATDSLLNYYSAKCATSNIEFTCILSGNLSDSLDKKISATDFNSILADLIENAFIATKCNQGHHIHVVISAINPTIDVYDSGAPFDIKVLANLGLKRITTHKGTGSGIGLTSIYEFTSKYNARLTIDETAQIDPRFTKKVSISFNTEKEYKLITSRTKEEIKYLYRREDIKIEQPA